LSPSPVFPCPFSATFHSPYDRYDVLFNTRDIRTTTDSSGIVQPICNASVLFMVALSRKLALLQPYIFNSANYKQLILDLNEMSSSVIKRHGFFLVFFCCYLLFILLLP
jgi:hypothetical protein